MGLLLPTKRWRRTSWSRLGLRLSENLRNSPLFEAKDPQFLRMYAKRQRNCETCRSPGGQASIQGQFMGYSYAGRANGLSSKGLLVKQDLMRPCDPTAWFKSVFRLWLGIEPSEEERRAFLEEEIAEKNLRSYLRRRETTCPRRPHSLRSEFCQIALNGRPPAQHF